MAKHQYWSRTPIKAPTGNVIRYSTSQIHLCVWNPVTLNPKKWVKPYIHCTQVPETSFDRLFLELYWSSRNKFQKCMQAFSGGHTVFSSYLLASLVIQQSVNAKWEFVKCGIWNNGIILLIIKNNITVISSSCS